MYIAYFPENINLNLKGRIFPDYISGNIEFGFNVSTKLYNQSFNRIPINGDIGFLLLLF